METTKNHPTRVKTLTEGLRLFVTYPGPWIIAITGVLAWSAKFYVGGWGWIDLAVAAGVLLFWPIQEWLIHVFILHFKPIPVFGHTIDLHVAQKHRAHHADPHKMDLTFVPMRTLLSTVFIALPVLLFVWNLVLPISVGLTAVAVFATFGLVYEWVHFLVHTSYKAKTQWYRALWQHHKWHHFKNENYWFGVSRIEGDTLLGTAPSPAEVETSGTCKTLI